MALRSGSEGGDPQKIFDGLHETVNRTLSPDEVETFIGKFKRQQDEMTAVLKATRIIMESKSFGMAARSIFDLCKELTGATAGYIALTSKDHLNNDLLFLDSGGAPCTVDPSMPMPIRGMRGEVYRSGRSIYENSFMNSEWNKLMPKGHSNLENVLFAPLKSNGDVVGLIGLSNKPGGFNADDLRIVSSIGEITSIGLMNSWTMESLQHSEEQFRSVVQTANDAIVSIDMAGDILFWNRRAELIFGYSAEDVAGRSMTMIMPERFREAHKAGLNRVSSGGESRILGKTTVEVAGLKKDGTEFPIELSLSRWTGKDGLFFTGVIRDVTERKGMEEELSRKAEQLEAANKELEAFSYSVSHDLRVPLRAISGFSNILAEEYVEKLDDEGKRFLRIIIDNVQRMDALISDLLLFSRMGRKELVHSDVDIEGMVRSTFQELIAGIKGRSFDFNVGPLCKARGDRTMLQQVIVNLLSNAIKFTSHNENAKIEVGCYKNENENVHFIKDNGVGFDMKYSDKLFGVFQRLHSIEEFEGTGVGLAVSKRIIERHGGRMWGEGVVNEGATFYFSIPR